MPYASHGIDRGYNGIGFSSAANVWVNQVAVENADTAVALQFVDHATVMDLSVLATLQRAPAADGQWQRQGHRALSLSMCQNVLVVRLTVDARFYHDVSLGRGAFVNALTGGSALDLNLHHEYSASRCVMLCMLCCAAHAALCPPFGPLTALPPAPLCSAHSSPCSLLWQPGLRRRHWLR